MSEIEPEPVVEEPVKAKKKKHYFKEFLYTESENGEVEIVSCCHSHDHSQEHSHHHHK